VAIEPTGGDAILRATFAPWVQDLGLTVESVSDNGQATLRLPWSDRLAREGGALSARITKLGRTMAFADITMTADDVIAAHATTVYALLG